MTDEGLEILKVYEVFKDRMYLDDVGKPTIGYGHVILPGEHFDEPITEDEALELLHKDVEKHESEMLSMVSVPLTLWQRDALSMLMFNIGGDNFRTSTLRKELNAGADAPVIADQFTRWVFAKKRRLRGLVKRRNAEAARFLGANPILCLSIYHGGDL
jgi:lysozyme